MSKVFVGGMYAGKELVKGGGVIDGKKIGVEELRAVLNDTQVEVIPYVVVDEDEELDLSLMHLTNELTARKLAKRKKALRLFNRKGGRR